MAKGDSNVPLLVILIGGSADEFARQTRNVLQRLGVEFVLCDNVYSAVGDLAKIKSRNVLIIGRFGLLSREQGRFFDMARANGYRICCFADRELLRRQRLILKAIESGAYIIDKAAELEDIIMTSQQDGYACSSADIENRRASGFLKNEFLTTKAELDALLEVQSDEKL